jgi:uroporphyrin-III C-methyltransferase
MKAIGSVKIVGAGPGDPELISLKGLKAIRQADVIVYDALVDPVLLTHAAPACKLIYAGKRKGHKAFEQDEINDMLVSYSLKNQAVVRLKGGDPFVFGRGHEELEYATRHGIAAEIIPGISSAIAAPAAAGIPLTKRHVNESFWVITGTLCHDQMSRDLFLAAQSSATVVVLMGLSHLAEIVSLFQKERSAQEPIAIIQHATCATQKIVTGTLENIEHAVRLAGIETPAIIVIGQVVDERIVLKEIKEQTSYAFAQEIIPLYTLNHHVA